MSKVEINIMIGINKNNLKVRREFYLAEKDVKQKTALLKLMIRTNREIQRLSEIKKQIA